MKKYVIISLCVIIQLICLTACGMGQVNKSERVQVNTTGAEAEMADKKDAIQKEANKTIYTDTIKYNEEYYHITNGRALELDAEAVGIIKDAVPAGELPKENLQSNNESYVNCNVYEYEGDLYIERGAHNNGDAVYVRWEQGKQEEGDIAVDCAPELVFCNNHTYDADLSDCEWLDELPSEAVPENVSKITFFDAGYLSDKFPAATTNDTLWGADVYTVADTEDYIYVAVKENGKVKYAKLLMD